MKAAILTSPQDVSKHPLEIGEVPQPEAKTGHVLLRVRACGVCRTDLHIVEGELPPRRERVVPGHQIVGEIVKGATAELPLGTRMGVCWVGGVDGNCWYCQRGLETSATRLRSLATPWTAAMPNMHLPAPISCFPFPRPSMICTPPRSCAPALSVFGVFV